MWSFLRQRVATSLVRTQLANDSSSITKHKKTVEDLAKIPTNQLIQGINTSDKKNDGENNYKKRKTCNEQQDFHPQYDCSLLETVGWVGTALTLGLNFKLCHKVHIDRDVLCQKPLLCRGVTNFLWSVVSALPTKHITKFALPDNSKATSSSHNEQHVTSTKEPSTSKATSQTNKQPTLDSIKETKKQLEAISRAYFGQLETIAGLEAIEKDSKKGLFHFEEGSKLGNAKAHFNLGVCYETGRGTQIDMRKAAFHYGEASKANHPIATYNLGVFHLEGKEDLAQNIDLGLELIEKAATLGLVEAKTYMGIYFFEKSNWNKAFPLLKEASKEDAEAQYYLSRCYKYGLGVKPNAKLAEKYLNLSSESGFDQGFDWMDSKNEENVDFPILEQLNLPNQPSLHTSTSSPDLSPTQRDSYKNVNEIAISRYLDIILPKIQNDPNVNFILGDSYGLDNFDSEINNLEFLSLSDKYDNSFTLSKVNNILVS